jgi:choline dehydrogenase-like flavoprotein
MSGISVSNVTDQKWDVIVVGTGMGGATLGYALAKAGKRVLFCEKGSSSLQNFQTLRGGYAESFFSQPVTPQPEHRDVLTQAGRYSDLVEDRSFPASRRFIPFIGSGTGGSTALYGMALERFFPADFWPRLNFSGASETTLPERWPISYAELVPYYEAAEELYRVRGTADSLRETESFRYLAPPSPLTPPGNELFHFFCRKGLHPYRLPMACEYVPGCECCQGYLCPKDCKNDANRICLQPAITHYGAQLLDNCNVLKLDATRTKVTGIVCFWRGMQITLQGHTVVLAAGALESPCLLLRSASELWPQGLGNDSGMVGRNLMRHHIDLHVIFPRTRGSIDNRQKELAFNDFYRTKDWKFGSVQSFGRLPPAEILVESIEQELRQGTSSWAASSFKLAKPVVKRFLELLVSKGIVLATILEDLPYADNTVEPLSLEDNTNTRPSITYRVRPYDQQRIDVFRTFMKEALKPYRAILLKQAENNERIAHACGTCRFGSTSSDSVLDKYNKAHGLSNLYIVDSSFFPSSGGTNPSLTIAANALRVAAHIERKE